MVQIEVWSARPSSPRARVGPLVACIIGYVMLVGCGEAMHQVVHTAIHGTLNTQFRSAGIAHPEPLSEALEYFCLDDTDRARGYIQDAYRSNAPEQLMAVARVLRDIAPLLGSYGEKVVPFLTFLSGDEGATSGAASDSSGATSQASARERPARGARGAGAMRGESVRSTSSPAEGLGRCGTNLGQAGESCTGSPDCQAGLGCFALLCRPRSATVEENSALVADEEPLPPPAPTMERAAPGVPAQPSPRELRTVLEPLAEQARRCAPRLRGSVPISLVVVSDGSVTEAHVRGPLESTRAATCIQDVVMSLRFPPFTQLRLPIAWVVPLNTAEALSTGR